MDNEHESEEDNEEKIGFGDKFTRWFVGAIPGFLVTMLFEYLYTRWVIERKKDGVEDENTEN